MGKGVFTSVPNSSASDWYADHCKTMVAYIEKVVHKKIVYVCEGGLSFSYMTGSLLAETYQYV